MWRHRHGSEAPAAGEFLLPVAYAPGVRVRPDAGVGLINKVD